jgi:type IX secretion system PorP/SprF family membrane protein
MKKLALIIIVSLLPLGLFSQMAVLTDQYFNNTLSINPAYAGSEDALSITAAYRNQWTGFNDAPRSYAVTLHSPVRYDRVGIGLLLTNSTFSIYRETSLMGSYAYRMEVHGGTLAFGLGFGAAVKYVDWNSLDAADANDILLAGYPQTAILPDFSAGTYYTSKRFFAGFSVPLFISHELSSKAQKYSMSFDPGRCNYYLEGGYYIHVARQIRLVPSILVKYHPGDLPQADWTARMFLGEKLGFGFGYRNRDTLLGLLQIHFNRQAMISYSYCFNTGRVGTYLNGSHEVVLNYLFDYSYRMTSPRQF